ncbi:ABC transporter ATP-binding protein [Thermovirga sp.]|uniref:ABC transporter ATP-binding protein n=1 Tax=Thermovirga sp. TaxID=2699834 RepID=UPI0025ED6417|nr:ABC transporter ATP-binding protein [Thermovirga sp.]MBO8154419.1 ABC transporter ATP-binding protein [Thermovirga sp.]
MSKDLLKVEDLRVYYPIKDGFPWSRSRYIKAVEGVAFEIKEGETLGLVGESGCGKSTTGRAILRLVEPQKGSKIFFEDQNILEYDKRKMIHFRKKVQIIFQDPYGSLNPRMTLGDTLEEVLAVHGKGQPHERRKQAAKLLDVVGLPKQCLSRYPHEFSGGQRQRVVIARALAVEPKLIICDEPVSALDVSVQAQIINLLEELQREYKLTYLFISHDMAVVRHISTKVAVMYLGKIFEIATTDELFDNPLHPYTRALLAAIPKITDKRKKEKRMLLEGDVPSPLSPPTGCRFRTRCPLVEDICAEREPGIKEPIPGHFVACHFV